MPFVRKCEKCGLDLTDPSASNCPVCGASLVKPPGGKIWIVALFQMAMVATFMLVFHFPKPMIAAFLVFILIGTSLSAWFKKNPSAVRPASQRPISQPVRFQILNLGLVLSAFAIIATLLFSFVIFLDAWNKWHLYAGLEHHEADFVVTRAYYQVHTRGSVDVYASGVVEGHREWMSLMSYLHTRPQSEEELDERVPVGTSIRIYFYPSLRGRSRVVFFTGVTPDEVNRRLAMKALNYGLMGIVICAALIFLLSRLRKSCYADDVQVSLKGSASGL